MKGWSGFVNSPVKQRTDTTKVDPDAPGTPGKPGYEPPVEYKDLDEKGKKLWHKVRGTKYTPEKKEPTKSPAKQTEKTTKRLLGGTKTVKRDAEGKKTMVLKTRKSDKEGNVKYKTKYKHSRGKHTSKGKYSEKTGQDVGPTKETRKRKGEKKETWTED